MSRRGEASSLITLEELHGITLRRARREIHTIGNESGVRGAGIVKRVEGILRATEGRVSHSVETLPEASGPLPEVRESVALHRGGRPDATGQGGSLGTRSVQVVIKMIKAGSTGAGEEVQARKAAIEVTGRKREQVTTIADRLGGPFSPEGAKALGKLGGGGIQGTSKEGQKGPARRGEIKIVNRASMHLMCEQACTCVRVCEDV